MKQKTYYILIISILSFVSSYAQDVKEVLRFADQQFAEGNYEIASKEYNRAFFFGYPQKDYLSIQIAHCYFQQNNFKQAINFYDKAYYLCTSDSLKNECLLGASFSYMLQGEYILSMNELLNFEENSSKQQQIQMHFLKGITLYGIEDDSAAYHQLKTAMNLSGISDEEIVHLEEEFAKVYQYQKRFNPKRSYVMSGLLPGSGQFAVGEFKEGLNSMLLIGGLYLVAVKIIQLYSFWDGVIALFPWIQRYWMGGMDRSKELAMKKIDEKRYESYLKILELSIPESFK